jgi:autotransporter-associated beta strand protein
MKRLSNVTPIDCSRSGSPRRRLAALLPALALALAPAAYAASGVWTNRTASSWSVATNWTAGVVAEGADNLANFATLPSGIASLTVTLDSPRTLGNLKFGSVTNLYLVGGSTLTLQNSTNLPNVNAANQTARVDVPLASGQPVLFDGSSLAITNDNNTYAGATTVNAGTLAVTGSGTLPSAATLTVATNATLALADYALGACGFVRAQCGQHAGRLRAHHAALQPDHGPGVAGRRRDQG